MSLNWAEELMEYIEVSSENPEYEGGFESELCRGFQLRDSRGKLIKTNDVMVVDVLDVRTERGGPEK